MTVAVYTVGPPIRPPINHDNGFLDRFPRRDATSEDWFRLQRWVATLEAGEALQKLPWVPHNDLSDALGAYRHFLFGDGKDRIFSYERYVSGDLSGRTTLKSATVDACLGAEQLYHATSKILPIQFQMTGTAILCGGGDAQFPYPETENWQKAIGGHVIWLSAVVDVSKGLLCPFFQMVLTVHAEDRYNFNPGAQDIATGIPDADNGVFEVTGLAKQYMNYSTLFRVVRWDLGATANPKSTPTDSGRQRQPQDNRRIRNRI